MANKKKAKRRLGKIIDKRSKELEKDKLDVNWRKIWVKSGVLKEGK